MRPILEKAWDKAYQTILKILQVHVIAFNHCKGAPDRKFMGNTPCVDQPGILLMRQ